MNNLTKAQLAALADAGLTNPRLVFHEKPWKPGVRELRLETDQVDVGGTAWVMTPAMEADPIYMAHAIEDLVRTLVRSQ